MTNITAKTQFRLLIFIASIFLITKPTIGQNHYEKLKQFYKFNYEESCKKTTANDCQNLTNNLTAKICAVKKFLKTDSILHLYSDSVKAEIIKLNDSTLITSFNSFQSSWKQYLSAKSLFIGRKYQMSNGHTKSIINIEATTFLMELKVNELKAILNYYQNQKLYLD